MHKLAYKIGSGIAAGVLLASTLAPAAFADTSVNVSDNGRDSDNIVNIINRSTTRVNQTNVSRIDNDIRTFNNTGNNRVDDNNGDVDIRTGNAISDVSVVNKGNTNILDLGRLCGDCNNDTRVRISDNGRDSDNRVFINTSNNTRINQTNRSFIDNDIRTFNNTGNNRVSDGGRHHWDGRDNWDGNNNWSNWDHNFNKKFDRHDLKKHFRDFKKHDDHGRFRFSPFFKRGGDVSIRTGDAASFVDVVNMGGTNIIR